MVTADLAFEVGAAAGTVRADGDRIRVEVDDPLAAIRATGAYGGRGGLALAADALRDNGVTLEVHGPGGRLATAGAGVDSRLGGLLTGSRAVAARPFVAVPARLRETAAFVASAGVALVAVRRLRRGRR